MVGGWVGRSSGAGRYARTHPPATLAVQPTIGQFFSSRTTSRTRPHREGNRGHCHPSHWGFCCHEVVRELKNCPEHRLYSQRGTRVDAPPLIDQLHTTDPPIL